ncbi:glycosyltransferase family 39 protein [Halosimplex aquaticum]|uniref:Glycosyltransferase family 39 protein n=1 Tax=Halosimplex aquaticum TaxID=3026162 RepID=A0ABD5XY18_9EURY|nr:glycosyltransferase family 39 protein [Halosimplex aquaticum]
MVLRRSSVAAALSDALPDRTWQRDAALVFLVALVLRAWVWSNKGTMVVRDATRYVTWCNEFSLGTLFGTRALVYSGYWLPYCGWLRATGEYVHGWVGVQIGLSALSCVLVYATARHLVGRSAGIVAGGALAVQWEVYRWAVRPQSEFMLTFALALALWRLAHYHTTPTTRNRVLALGTLGFAALVRPNGLPIVAAYFLYDLLPSTSDHRLNLGFPAKVNFALVAGFAAAIAYRLQFGWAKGSMLYHWRKGIIITPDRFVYDYTPASASGVVDFFVANAEHVVAIAVLRGLWFFSPVMPGWSTGHALRAGLTLTPLLVLAALGIGAAAAREQWDLLVLWGTPLVAVVVTAMGIWVAGWRNFLGPAVVVYCLFAGYYVSLTDWPRKARALTRT